MSTQYKVNFSGSAGQLEGVVHLPDEPPLVIAVVNFEGGGRILTQMTDRDPSQVKIKPYALNKEGKICIPKYSDGKIRYDFAKFP